MDTNKLRDNLVAIYSQERNLISNTSIATSKLLFAATNQSMSLSNPSAGSGDMKAEVEERITEPITQHLRKAIAQSTALQETTFG